MTSRLSFLSYFTPTSAEIAEAAAAAASLNRSGAGGGATMSSVSTTFDNNLRPDDWKRLLKNKEHDPHVRLVKQQLKEYEHEYRQLLAQSDQELAVQVQRVEQYERQEIERVRAKCRALEQNLRTKWVFVRQEAQEELEKKFLQAVKMTLNRIENNLGMIDEGESGANLLQGTTTTTISAPTITTEATTEVTTEAATTTIISATTSTTTASSPKAAASAAASRKATMDRVRRLRELIKTEEEKKTIERSRRQQLRAGTTTTTMSIQPETTVAEDIKSDNAEEDEVVVLVVGDDGVERVTTKVVKVDM